MTIFHRFCAVVPFFLLLAVLTGCAGGQGAWNAPSAPVGSAVDTSIYSETPAAELPSAPAAVPAQSAATQAVKVAILLPLSGSNAALGQSMLQAAQLAVFDLGYDNLELLPKDTARGAGQAATSAVLEGAQLILGPLFAGDVKAVKSATAARGINVIAFSTDWTLAGGNTFMMGFLPFGQVQRIVDYAAAHGVKSVAVASGADQYGTATGRAFEEEARRKGLILTGALSDPSGYDGVFVPAGAAALPGILQRVADKDSRKLGTGLWDDPRVTALPDMDGAWFAAPSTRSRGGFENRYQSTYGAKPERLASLAYDATALAVTLAKYGMERSGKPAFDAGSIANPNGFSGIDGVVRFSRSGLAERGLAVMEIRGGKAVEIDPAPATFQR